MRLLRTLRFRLRALFRGAQLDREMDEEMRFHLEREADDNATDGIASDEARRAAALAFGGHERMREETRDARGVRWIEELLRDFRHGLRALRRSPGFTAVSMLTLALAIGANTAVFSLFNGFIWKPVLPDGDSKVFHVTATSRDATRATRAFSGDDVAAMRAEKDLFAAVVAHWPGSAVLGLEQQQFRRGTISSVTPDFFPLCSVRPEAGRLFTEDESEGRASQAVLSHDCWMGFGGSPDIIGRKITVDGELATVVGVAPPGFQGTTPMTAPDVWISLPLRSYMASSGRGGKALRPAMLQIIARLQPGVAPQQAHARLAALEPRLDALAPELPPRELRLQRLGRFDMPGRGGPLGQAVAIAGGLFLGLGAIVLLIASLNLANLQLARGAARRHELAVRLALGAARRRIVRLILCESLLLAVAGGAMGLVVSSWLGSFLARWLRSLTSAMGMGLDFDFSPDGRVLAATAAYGVLVTLLSSLVPAVRTSRIDPMEDLKRLGSTVQDTGGRWARLFSVRHGLVMAQLACSLALLVCGGLFLRFVQTTSNLDLGFRTHDQAVLEIDYGLTGREPTAAAAWSRLDLDPAGRMKLFREEQQRFAHEMRLHREETLARAVAVPGVRRAALASAVVYSRSEVGSRRLQTFGGSERNEAEEGATAAPKVRVADCAVTRGYFEQLGIPLLRGRDFTSDEVTDGRRVAIIDEQAAQLLFGQVDVVGRQVVLAARREGAAPPAPYEVVGLIRSPRDNPRTELPPMRIYRPFWTLETEGEAAPLTYLHLELSSPGACPAVLEAMQRMLADLDSGIRPQWARSMDDHIAVNPTFGILRFGASVFALIGAIALGMAAVGAYGLNAYIVSQRRCEFGVRRALGARPGQLFAFIMTQGAIRTAIALGAGLILASLAGLGLSKVFTLVEPFDLLMLVGAAVVLAAASLIACVVPARRAASVDPIATLRAE